VLAFLDDFWFRYITDIGNAGPDKYNFVWVALIVQVDQSRIRRGTWNRACNFCQLWTSLKR
jgi:hypothetical protein